MSTLELEFATPTPRIDAPAGLPVSTKDGGADFEVIAGNNAIGLRH